MMTKFYPIFLIFTIYFGVSLGIYANTINADDNTTSKSIRINNITITIKVEDAKIKTEKINNNDKTMAESSIPPPTPPKKVVKKPKKIEKSDIKGTESKEIGMNKKSKGEADNLEKPKPEEKGEINDKDYILPKSDGYMGKDGSGKKSGFGWFFHYFFSLLIITGLMGGAFLLLKKLRLRYLPEIAENEIRVLSKVSLDQRSKLVLIRVRGSDFLLSSGGNGLGLIKEFNGESQDGLITKNNSTEEGKSVE